jgi:hypothetical protein
MISDDTKEEQQSVFKSHHHVLILSRVSFLTLWTFFIFVKF